MSIFDHLNLVELNPNPTCVSCGEPVFSRSDNIGFKVADLVCCVDCYAGPPAWPDLADDA